MAFTLQHHEPAGSCRQLAIYEAPQHAVALDQDEPEGPPSVIVRCLVLTTDLHPLIHPFCVCWSRMSGTAMWE